MDLAKAIRLVRGAFVFLIPLVGVLLYTNAIPSRGIPQMTLVSRFFWLLMAISLVDVAAMWVIVRNMVANLGASDPAARSKALSAGAIILGLVGLSPLVYAVFYHTIGGAVPKALVIAAMSTLGHFMFISLIPKLTDSVTIKRP